jgi:ribosylpyrimidine nucleosidase
MSRPIVREQVTAGDIHGVSGLDGPTFSAPSLALDSRHAVDLIIETLLESDGDITLVPTGPLSNIAMALRKEPGIAPKIDRIVLMGGSYQLGNITPAAEFNMYADPEAAHIVLTCGRPVVMMTLDITRKVGASAKVISRVKSIGNPQSILFSEMMEFFAKTQKEIFGWDAPPLHDPTTIAWLIDPGCIELKNMRVEVELRGELTYGRTSCDFFGLDGGDEPGKIAFEERAALARPKGANAQVSVSIDADRFWDIVYDTFLLYGK